MERQPDRKEKPLGQMEIQLQLLVHPHLPWTLGRWAYPRLRRGTVELTLTLKNVLHS
jgi:hypothetical protein